MSESGCQVLAWIKDKGAETKVIAEQLKGEKYHCTTANYMDIYVESDADISGEMLTVKLDGKGNGEIVK